MNKPAEHGYDYLYNRADLAGVKQHQEAIEAITSFSEPVQAKWEGARNSLVTAFSASDAAALPQERARIASVTCRA